MDISVFARPNGLLNRICVIGNAVGVYREFIPSQVHGFGIVKLDRVVR